MTDGTGLATRRSALLPMALAVLAAGAARLWYLLSPVMQFSADEATTGIMVRDILGGRFYVFYAGQDYGGALEQYLEAAWFLGTRLPQNELTLRLPLVALSMASCALTWAVARQVYDDPVRPAVAAGLFAVSPWFNVIGSSTSFGFYAAGQCLLVAVVLAALHRRLAVTGLLAGLGLWTSPLILYALVPVLLWLLPTLRRDPRKWAALAGGTALGAAPLLGWLAVHRELPIPPEPAEASSIADRLGNLADPILRQYVGVTYSQTDGGLPVPLQYAVVLGLVLAYALAFRHRHGPAGLLLMVPPTVVVLYAASNSTWYVGTPRYLLVTYPLLAVGLAGLLRRWVLAVPALLGSAALCLGFFLPLAGGQTVATRDADLERVTDTLVAAGHTHVYADYWLAMPLQYLAGDRLTVATQGGVERFPAAQAEVAASADQVWVGSIYNDSADRVRGTLADRGIPYRTEQIGFVTVFYPLD